VVAFRRILLIGEIGVTYSPAGNVWVPLCDLFFKVFFVNDEDKKMGQISKDNKMEILCSFVHG
jgi:hypothetical protein